MGTLRRTGPLDRALLILIALALAAAGAGLLAVQLGAIGDLAHLLRALGEAPERPWWAPACLGAAVILLAFALWWLLQHRPSTRIQTLTLPGSRTGDQLRISPARAVATANTALAGHAHIHASRLRLQSEAGTLVLTGTVTIDPQADLQNVIAAVQECASQFGAVLGRTDLTGRVRLAVARRTP